MSLKSLVKNNKPHSVRVKIKMAPVIDEELTQVIYQTLNSCLSPDKAIIELAEQQLTVLQVRPGKMIDPKHHASFFKINIIPFKL